METSKLVAFKPNKDHQGNHKFFDSSIGRLWKFNVEFENGDMGEASSSKETPSWKIGKEYTYEVQIIGNYSNIRVMRLAKKKKNSFSKSERLESEDWKTYCAQRTLKLLIEFNPSLSLDEIWQKTDEIMPIIVEITKNGSTDCQVWSLSLNSLECLLRKNAEISKENILQLNDFCKKYQLGLMI